MKRSTSSKWAFVDLFSGCGGMSAGLIASGMKHVFAMDNDPWANATYGRNLGFTPESGDISELLSGAQLDQWIKLIRRRSKGHRLLLAGGPPCQGFSSHVKAIGDRQGRNELVSVFGRLAAALRPDVVLMENVGDLVASRSWDVFTSFRETLEVAGYEVRARILNMAEFGVPQERFRTVVLATRRGVVTFPAPTHATPSNYSTVKEWIGDLPPIASGQSNPDDPMHVTSRHRPSTLEILRQVPHDGGLRPPGVGPECLDRTRNRHGGYTDVYGRLAWSEPAPTITARCRTPSCGRFVHPEQDRGMTAREAGLLQTFSADWYFEGPFDDRFKQIGNAVPPLGAQVLGRHIIRGLPTSDREAGIFEVKDVPVGLSFSVLIPSIRKRGGVLVR